MTLEIPYKHQCLLDLIISRTKVPSLNNCPLLKFCLELNFFLKFHYVILIATAENQSTYKSKLFYTLKKQPIFPIC